MFKKIRLGSVLAVFLLPFLNSHSSSIELDWITCEFCPEEPEVSIIDNTIIMGDVRTKNELLNRSVHGAATLLPPASSYYLSIEYELYTWDAYNQLTFGGTGFWDSFSVSITELPYWELELIDPITTGQTPGLGFLWGGTEFGNGMLESLSGADIFVLPGDPAGTNYLNVVLDTKTLPESNHAFPSWGTITVEIFAEGPPGEPTCNDGIDNDGDEKKDNADPDCKTDNLEKMPTQDELKLAILDQIEEYLRFDQLRRSGKDCFIENEFFNLADIEKIEDRIFDESFIPFFDVQIYFDKDYLNDSSAEAAYVDFGSSSSKARKEGNPSHYINDIVLKKDPTNAYDVGLARDLIHETFHAIFDLHDAELDFVFVPHDEALTSYFEKAVDEVLDLGLDIERELKKARKCDSDFISTRLTQFENELNDFLQNPVSGSVQFGPISTEALELMNELTGFNIPITDILYRYTSGECGLCN